MSAIALPETISSNCVYKFSSKSCTTSLGRTYRYIKVRASEQQGVSPKTRKHKKGRDQMLICDYQVAWGSPMMVIVFYVIIIV